MAAKVGFLLYCIAMFMLLTTTESQANYYSPGTAAQHAGGHSPAPAPAPQATKFPMHGSTPGSLQPQECLGRCTTRCSATAYKKPCMFFCQKCCATCLCVPPGTYGNKEFCPCYNNWKTKRGGPKCP